MENSIQLKFCNCCKTEKSFDLFNKRNGSPDYICRKCHNEKVRLRTVAMTPEQKKARLDRARYYYNKKINDPILSQEHKEKEKRFREENREKLKLRKAEYYSKNRQRLLEKDRLKRTNNPEKVRADAKRNKLKNLEDRKRKRNAYEKNKFWSDKNHRLLINLRNRIRIALANNSKGAKTRELLGCPVEDFKKHLESQFTPQMTWENYGEYWSIDHIRPCCSFDLADKSQQFECFNYKNCRPLTILENSSKSRLSDAKLSIKNIENCVISE